MYSLLEKISSRGLALGMATRSGPSHIRHYSGAGMDFLVVDLMHGPMGWTEMGHLCALARGDGVYPLARIQGHPWGSGAGVLDRRFPADALKAVTSGAEGIIWSVASVDEVRSVAHLIDDWHQSRPVAGPKDVERIQQEVVQNRLLLPLVESASIVSRLDDVLAIEGIAGVWLGLTDISHQLGHSQRNDHPDVMRVLEAAVAAAERRGRFVMANVGYAFDTTEKQVSAAVQLAETGVRMVMLATTEFQVHVGAKALRAGILSGLNG